MKLNNYIKIREKVNSKFYETYNSGKLILNIFSFISSLALVFLAFLFSKELLMNSFEEFPYKESITITLALIFSIVFELLKRELLDKTFFNLFGYNFNERMVEIIVISIMALIITASSVFLSLKGVKSFSDKSDKIESVVDNKIELEISKIKLDYDIQKNNLITSNNKFNSSIEKLINADIENNTSRNNKQIDKLRIDIEKNKSELKSLDSLEQNEINKIKSESISKMERVKSKNDSTYTNSIFISLFFEFMIIIGIAFTNYHKIRGFIDNPEMERLVKKRFLYLKLVKIVYKNGDISEGDRLVSIETLYQLARVKNLSIGQKSFIEAFYKELTEEGVFYISNKRRFAKLSYQEAKKHIENYNI